MSIDILIGCQNYWDFNGYKQIRGESGPVAIASRLGIVLSEPYRNTKNISNTSVKFVNSHLMKVESLVHESIKVKQDLSSIFFNKNIQMIFLFRKKILQNFLIIQQFLKIIDMKSSFPSKTKQMSILAIIIAYVKTRLKTLLNNTFNLLMPGSNKKVTHN